MNAEKIRKMLEEVNEEIAKLSREKTKQTECARELDKRWKELSGKHAGKPGEKCGKQKECEDRMRKMQQKLDETLIRLTKYELDAVKIQEQLNVDPQMRQELAENRIHLKQRAEETKERIEKHKRRTQIPWEVYEEALKDTKEKEDLEKRLEELRKREVFTRG